MIKEKMKVHGYITDAFWYDVGSLERFYSTRKSSGIGLSFCKQIMKLHNGRIKVITSEGSTIFSLSF